MVSLDNNTPVAPLHGILETVLYCTTSNEADTRHFYEEVLKLRKVSRWSYRLGPQLFLLFNTEETRSQAWPPGHGTTGSGHICFTVAPEGYESWRSFLEGQGTEIIEDIDWGRGTRSFYFCDPAGNVLEIANGDMWPA